MLKEEILDFIVCIRCKGDLKKDESYLICNKCKIKYPIKKIYKKFLNNCD